MRVLHRVQGKSPTNPSWNCYYHNFHFSCKCFDFTRHLLVFPVHPGVSLASADSQGVGESERSREQILQTLSDLSRGFQDIADRSLLVLHLEVRYAEPFIF